MKTFRDLYIEGKTTSNQVDDYIKEWHNGNSTKSLASFLGFSTEEYSLFVAHPRVLWERLDEQKGRRKP